MSRFLQIHQYAFVVIVSLAQMLLFQGPFLDFAFEVSDWPSSQGILQIASVEIVQFLLLSYLLIAVSIFSVKVMKAVAMLLFILNAAAYYFMAEYGVLMTSGMMANILGTHTREVQDLMHLGFFLHMLLYAVIPCVLIWTIKINMAKFWGRMTVGTSILVLLGVWLYATSPTWLWYDRHLTGLGARVLPWSYVVNTGRHLYYKSLSERVQTKLPDAKFDQKTPARKQVVVLVIGEAARADNFSLYGYDRETNPFTKQQGIATIPVGQSCGTSTIAGAACILTHEGSEASETTTNEPLPNYLTRHGVETIYRTNNNGLPPIKTTSRKWSADIAKSCTGENCPAERLDEALTWGLIDEVENSSSERVFVLLHLFGSHGPSYFEQYPDGFEHFSPVCKTVQVGNCSYEELVNAYDNSIRFTDYVLAEFIKDLRGLTNSDAAMIYVSDHGQSLGEAGVYLHGLPNAIAPAFQRRIPFLVWMSDGFKQSRQLTNADIIPSKSHPHDFAFHSVMGAFKMRSDIYKPQFDLFNLPDKVN
ncbi:MAG: sulfatase-like hydrolase/transferase [Rhizobiaceae bacterium]